MTIHYPLLYTFCVHLSIEAVNICGVISNKPFAKCIHDFIKNALAPQVRHSFENQSIFFTGIFFAFCDENFEG